MLTSVPQAAAAAAQVLVLELPQQHAAARILPTLVDPLVAEPVQRQGPTDKEVHSRF